MTARFRASNSESWRARLGHKQSDELLNTSIQRRRSTAPELQPNSARAPWRQNGRLCTLFSGNLSWHSCKGACSEMARTSVTDKPFKGFAVCQSQGPQLQAHIFTACCALSKLNPNRRNHNADEQRMHAAVQMPGKEFGVKHRYLVAAITAHTCLFLSSLATAQNTDWAINTAWGKHVEWLLNQQMSCQKAVDDVSPCNRFVGQALQRVWNIDDFKTGSPAPSDYMLANDIASKLLTLKAKWTELGRANDQDALNRAAAWASKGNAVVAVRPDQPNGHVAIILPGPLSPSGSWGLKVPNSASFLYNNPKASYVGKPLSNAFGSDKKADVKLYYRTLN